MAMNSEVRRKTQGLAIKAQSLVGSLRGERLILNFPSVFPAEVNIGDQSRNRVQGRFLGDRGETKERTVLLPNGFAHRVVH
jgi:hypothetical protein